uniref:Ig-like domain-containing protein n=1 Tax=Sphenodon punctatus TaxID=8508 RepID=A0A8D0G0L8_SPHPU
MEKKTVQKSKDKDTVKVPSVSLVLPSPTLRTPNAIVWLACNVSGFSPAEILIQWKRDNSCIDPLEYFTQSPVAQVENATVFSTQSLLKIPASEWRSGSLYTCLVGHESLSSMINDSKTVFNFLKPNPPQVKDFHALDSEEHNMVTCFASGFSPKDIDIQWRVKGKHHNCTSGSSPVALGDGKFQQNCSLVLDTEDWKKSGTYTCHVNHTSTNTVIEKKLKIEGTNLDPFSDNKTIISTQLPSFEDLFINQTAALTCTTPLVDATINWTMDGEPVDPESVRTKVLNHTGGSLSLQSQLWVNLNEWNATGKFSCMINSSSGETEQHIKRKKGPLKPPKISLLPLPSKEACGDENVNLTLLCVIQDFYPEEIFMRWQEEDEPMNEDEEDGPRVLSCDHGSQQCSLVSKMAISKSEWMLGISYTCLVFHTSSEKFIARSVNSYTDSWDCAVAGVTRCEVRDDNSDEYSELDETNCVWTRVSTFIALFLITLFYSGFVTFIKVK